MFSRVRNTKISGYYRWMIDFGIYERLVEKVVRKNKLRKPRKNKEENEVMRPEGVRVWRVDWSLSLFFGGVISLALTEIRHIIWNMLVKFYLSLRMALKVLKHKIYNFFKRRFNLCINVKTTCKIM